MFYVYEHIRNDTNAIFYVGKGKKERAYRVNNRNEYWHNVVNKCNGYTVKFVVKDVDEELVYLVEEERIDQLKRLGIKLANINAGGAWAIKERALNYTVTCGARLLVGQ